jgi:hypothetical protein
MASPDSISTNPLVQAILNGHKAELRAAFMESISELPAPLGVRWPSTAFLWRRIPLDAIPPIGGDLPMRLLNRIEPP